MKQTLLLLMMFIFQQVSGIDRQEILSRHNPHVIAADPLASLTVGNGAFAVTVDVTGLQSYPEYYKDGIPLCAQSDWGWHSFPNPLGITAKDSQKRINGGIYAVEHKSSNGADERQVAATKWLRENPHRLNLGAVGLEMNGNDGHRISVTELSDINQTLDLWQSSIKSSFTADGSRISVSSLCHPDRDCMAAKVTTSLFGKGQARITFRYPYPTGMHSDDASNWDLKQSHTTDIIQRTAHSVTLKRTIDTTVYYILIAWEGNARFDERSAHCFTLTPADRSIAFTCTYSKDTAGLISASYKETVRAGKVYWKQYWEKGGIADFSHCTNPAAAELERRMALSLYLTAVQCRGSMPPQESGLTYNTWFGRPHLEMAWWHLMDFVLWGHQEVLEESMKWYNRVAMDNAREIAHRQGLNGVRWMKMTDPWAGEAPSNVGSFLIWQQPHYIYFAEELLRCCTSHEDSVKVIGEYAGGVEQTAAFIADFMTFNTTTEKFEVRGATALQESITWSEACNQPYELAYCHYALKTAQEWRKMQGLSRHKRWDEIIEKHCPLPMEDGVYTAGKALRLSPGNEDEWKRKTRRDHPSVIGVCGCLPDMGLYDRDIMMATLSDITENWDWPTTWGWDYGMMVMAATILGQGQTAIDMLLKDTQKNTYLLNGHNYQDERLRIYLPGNASLLIAVAMMCTHDVFPKDGTWDVRWELPMVSQLTKCPL